MNIFGRFVWFTVAVTFSFAGLAAPAKDYGDLGVALMGAERVGQIHLGMSEKEARAELGRPAKETALVEWDSDGLKHKQIFYPTKGLELGIVKDKDLRVDTITAKSPCSFRTSRGIGIGSTEAEVMKAYRAEIDPSENKPGSESIVAGTVYGGVAFRMLKGKVKEIFVGASAE